MKLELKHLTNAMVYNQKVFYFDDERELSLICKIIELRKEELTITNGEYQYDVLFDDIKIVCLPLSDLTKEIEHNGEKFVPLYRLIKEDKAFTNDFINVFGYEELKVSVYELLLEWHFDVFGLIEKGLAVDINTIE